MGEINFPLRLKEVLGREAVYIISIGSQFGLDLKFSLVSDVLKLEFCSRIIRPAMENVINALAMAI